MRALKRLKSAATAAVAAGMLLAVAGPGQAARADGPQAPGAPLYGLQIVKQTGKVDNFERQMVFCPPGTVAIGGGGEASIGWNPGSDTLALVGSFPVIEGGDATGWIANARTYTSDPLTVTVYAVCAERPSGYEVLTKDETPVAWGKTSTLTCPAGKIVTGGGGEVLGSRTGLSKSYPAPVTTGLPNQWAVGGYNDQSFTADMTTYALCAAPIQYMTVTSHSTTSDSPVGGLLACPTGKTVMGGGASANGDTAALTSTKPALAREGAVRDGWWAQASTFYDPSSADLYVMCR